MRILRGALKGKNIYVPASIRPVSLRVKKGLFEVLREVLEDARVLDLFAGSGALGIESVSCGSRSATFIDVHRACVSAIRRSVTLLKIPAKCEVYKQDAFKAIKDIRARRETFDIVFLDPPYYHETSKKTLQTIDEYDIVAPSGYVVAVYYRNERMPLILNHFENIVRKEYGQSRVAIYQKK